MLRAKEREFAPLCNLSVEDLVPGDHFYRFLDAKLDLSFVRDWVAGKYAERGRPAVDPVVFFKLQLVMFFEGLRSERKLMEVAADRLSLRWYLAYDLGERLPDHSSLAKIRQRLGLELFERFFERVVELCRDAGLVWGEELFFDATKVRANADLDSLVPRFYWKAKQRRHLAELFAEGPEPAGQSDMAATGAEAAGDLAEERAGEEPVKLATGLTPEREAELAAEDEGSWRLLERRRLDPDRPGSGHYRRVNDLRVSATDPDAALMNAGRETALGYHDHYVVDGGKARVILAARVTPADVMENTPLRDLLWRARFRWKLRPERAVGDTTYGTVENIRALEDAGIRAYVPLPDLDKRTPYFGQKDFSYDAARDAYRCPAGRTLDRHTADYSNEIVRYRAEPATRNACALKARCTPGETGRTVTRSFYEEYLERVARYHDTPAYRKAMRKRQVWVEPRFGEAKGWHGLRRFRLRGLDNVNIEGLTVAAGQNLERLLKGWGWGRRPWPVGGAGWPSPRPFSAHSSLR